MVSNQRTLFKLITAVVLMLVSATAIAMWSLNELFLPLSIGVFTISLLIVSPLYFQIGRQRTRFRFVIAWSVLLAVSFRFLVFGFPASLIGMDTDKFALLTRLTMLEGRTPLTQLAFYSKAPLFHLYAANFSFLSDLRVSAAMGIFSIAFGILSPLTAAWIGLLVAPTRKYDVAAVSAVLTAVVPSLVRHSYWPMPQMFGIVFFTFMIAMIIKGVYANRAHIVALLVFLLGLLYTHKILLQTFVLAAMGILGWDFVTKKLDRDELSPSRTVSSRLILLGVILAVVQWVFLTNYVDNVILWVHGLLTSSGLIDRAVSHPPYGSLPRIGIFELFHHRSQAFLVLGVGGLAWAYVAFRLHHLKRIRILLFVVGVFTAITVVAGVKATSPNAPNPIRFYMMVVTLVVVLIGVAAVRLVVNNRGRAKKAVSLLLVVVLVFQVFSAFAYPVYPGTPRYYLTQSEYDAKAFSYAHIDDAVYTDTYYASHLVAVGRTNDPTGPIADDFDDRFVSYSLALFNGSVHETEYPYIAHRTRVRVHWIPPGVWSANKYDLRHDPTRQFDANYSRIYASEDVHIYRG